MNPECARLLRVAQKLEGLPPFGEDAGPVYFQALKQFPDESQAWSKAAGFLLRTDQPEEAASHVEEALRLDPKNASAWHLRSMIEEADGRMAEALSAMRKSAELAPDDTFIWLELGKMLDRAGEHAEAETVLRHVLELDSDRALAYRLRGDARFALGRPKEALADYEAALRIDEGYLDALLGATLAALEVGDMDLAEAFAERAVASDAKELHGYVARGAVLARKGEGRKAMREFRQVILVDHSFTPAYVQKILLEIELGRTNEAWHTLQDAISWHNKFDKDFVRRVAGQTGHTPPE